MQIGGYEFPDDLYYDERHGWLKVEGGVAIQGLSALGQALARTLIFVDLPKPGKIVKRGATLVSVESHKWVGRLPAMVSGRVLAVNEALNSEPSRVNRSPYEEGWMVKLEPSDLSELDTLLRCSDPRFEAFVRAEMEKYRVSP